MYASFLLKPSLAHLVVSQLHIALANAHVDETDKECLLYKQRVIGLEFKLNQPKDAKQAVDRELNVTNVRLTSLREKLQMSYPEYNQGRITVSLQAELDAINEQLNAALDVLVKLFPIGTQPKTLAARYIISPVQSCLTTSEYPNYKDVVGIHPDGVVSVHPDRVISVIL
ncbi:hypothetical protein SARC_10991 [Sphaeroforma arctica JP610]|uniref:Uncharacterized protein n=1 Tax=Sphaeroforma arctica JP610 TaxID=667725 RepID=A0A0L0FID0_9EUKA|nr:hypothetical protein SARC_10991 [Sphaeroforma arctica JP610]KNC76510.1 hypothetical protein SARC_10991 [Sphaeroforma arctica JP610]|eukprot:XP_014150412.1 hypothetical protein SARC_10991 [Sphaeroforma arctica JP610]